MAGRWTFRILTSSQQSGIQSEKKSRKKAYKKYRHVQIETPLLKKKKPTPKI